MPLAGEEFPDYGFGSDDNTYFDFVADDTSDGFISDYSGWEEADFQVLAQDDFQWERPAALPSFQWLEGVAKVALPIWANAQYQDQRRDKLQNPTYNPMFGPKNRSGLPSSYPAPTKAGFITGTMIGDGLIIGAVVLVAVALAWKS